MPAEILQRYLDDVGAAVMRDRFEDYAARVHLPFNLVTTAANIVVSSVEDLHDGFDDFVDMLASQGVTDLIRGARHAEFDAEGGICGVYETNLLNRGTRVVPSFYSQICLRRIDGTWKATMIRNTTSDTRWPILIPKVDPDLSTLESLR